MGKKDTIFALSTPSGKSAIAVFRVSGLRSHKLIKLVSSNKKNTPKNSQTHKPPTIPPVIVSTDTLT